MNHRTALDTSTVIHQISLSNGASKNNRFHQIKAAYFNILSFCFVPTNNAHRETIIEYPTSI
jgi:hypothetical protein